MWIKEIQIQNVIQYITYILYKQSYFIWVFFLETITKRIGVFQNRTQNIKYMYKTLSPTCKCCLTWSKILRSPGTSLSICNVIFYVYHMFVKFQIVTIYSLISCVTNWQCTPFPQRKGGGANCIKCQQIFKWETGKFLSEGVRVTGSIDELVA